MLNQPSHFKQFKRLCQTKFGLDFHDKNESALQQAIETRLQEKGIINSQEYLQLLENNKREQQEFICLLTINETYFYREEIHLEFLVNVLIPNIQNSKKSDEPIRILCVGCSTGAEPYSIAMALDQKFPNAAQLFSIIGSDVDYQVLNFAKQARYNALTFRALPLALKQRYFVEEKKKTHHGQEYRLIRKIRDMVSWQYFNIVSDPIESNTPQVDVIFFRNVSIYFDKQTLFKIHQKFAQLLKPDTFLIVGLTETLSNNLGPLSLKNDKNIYYFQNSGTSSVTQLKQTPSTSSSRRAMSEIIANKTINTKPLISKPLSSTPLGSKALGSKALGSKAQLSAFSQAKYGKTSSSKQPAHPAIKTNTSLQQKQQYNDSFEAIKELVVEKKHPQALKQIEDCLHENALPELKKDRAKFLLLRSYIAFNAQEFLNAKQDALEALSIEPFSIDVFLLLGMTCKWSQQHDDAISWFKKALYIHPHCWPAHYYLAGLYHETDSTGKAIQEYRLTIQQLEESEENFNQQLIIPLALPKSEIRLLAQRYLQQAESAVKGKRYGS